MPITEPRVGEAAHAFRLRCRSGEHDAPTSGFAPGFVQANVVMLQKEYAFDFLCFCLRNPKFCPLLAVTEPGQTGFGTLAADADIRTDIPRCVRVRVRRARSVAFRAQQAVVQVGGREHACFRCAWASE